MVDKERLMKKTFCDYCGKETKNTSLRDGITDTQAYYVTLERTFSLNTKFEMVSPADNKPDMCSDCYDIVMKKYLTFINSLREFLKMKPIDMEYYDETK